MTIGHVTPRVDAIARVTGQAQYTNDLKLPGMLYARIRRNVLFYLRFPLQAVWAAVNVFVCSFLSLGDLAEEPNNHLFVVRRP